MAGAVYRLPLEIGVGSKMEKVEFDQKRQRFEIASEAEPAGGGTGSECLGADGCEGVGEGGEFTADTRRKTRGWVTPGISAAGGGDRQRYQCSHVSDLLL